MTVSANDAHEYPIFNARYRVYFPILDADGDLVPAATGLDSERSIDGAAFADCTNEATEIASSSGIYYLDLTSAEMSSSCTTVQIKTSTSGAKTTVLTLYPRRSATIRFGTAQAGGSNTMTLDSGASAKDGAYIGCWLRCTNDTPANVIGQGRKILAYVGSTKVATVDSNWGTAPSSATTYSIMLFDTVNVNMWLGKEVADVTTDGYPLVELKPTVLTQINAEVVDALATDTYTEPVQGAPGVTISLAAKINYLYKAWRNKVTTTSSQYTLYADNTTTVDQKATLGDDGSTFTRGEIATGP